MTDLYYQYNPWWDEEYQIKHIIPRERYTSTLKQKLASQMVVILSGLRRIGKTTLMKLFIQDLIKTGTNPSTIFYVSCDDYQLNQKSIVEMVDDFRSIHKHTTDTPLYVFLDEITYKTEFHQQIKNLYDKGNVKIVASASSSTKLLDKKAYLTGRSLVIEVLPLTFEEYLTFKQIVIRKKDTRLTEAYFLDYMTTGGVPHYVLNGEREFLTNLVDDIINKDIVAEHHLKNSQTIRDFFLLLIERSGKTISINKIANILNISPSSSSKYLEYFKNTYLINLISRHGKTNEGILSPKKLYVADLGIKHAFSGLRDLGSYFENYVYNLIKTHDPRYVYVDGIEIDFMTRDQVLIEAKFNSTLTDKQQLLFQSTKAKKKLIIDSVLKLAELVNI